MKTLIAEDDLISLRRLEVALTKWGYEAVFCSNGKQPWERLQGVHTPKLADRIKGLQDSLQHIKTLQGILPICSYCKKIRNDQTYREEVKEYIVKHLNADFTHSICPKCYEKHVKPELENFKKI